MNKVATNEKLKNAILQLINAYKMLQIYPSHNPIPQNAITQAYNTITEVLNSCGSIYLKFSRQQIVEGNTSLFENMSIEDRVKQFTERIIGHGISSILIFHGLKKTELMALLNMLLKEREELEKEGGPINYSKKAEIEHIKINEIPREVEFEEKGEADDVSEAKKSDESDILDILGSILLKDSFTDEDLKLIGHLLSKPKDLRSVLYHVYRRGEKQGGNIDLLENMVLKLNELIKQKSNFSNVEEEGLIYAVLKLPQPAGGKLLVNIIFSAVRSASAREFLESISPEELARQILTANEKEITRVEKVALTLNNIDFEENYKDALLNHIKQGLIERGYSKEEAEVIVSAKQQESIEELDSESEGIFSSKKPSDFDYASLKLSDIEETPNDAKLLEYLQLEARRFRAESHIFSSILSLLPYVEKEDVLKEISKTVKMLLPSILESEDFLLLKQSIPFLTKLSKDLNLDKAKRDFAKEILTELHLEKNIYQIFEKIANSDSNSATYVQAKEILNILPRDIVISSLIKILSSEEMLSRRKILISLIAEIGKDSPELIGQRISSSSSKWFVVRNMCTILGLIRKPECIVYLKEATHHSDIRVKKEAVKSLAKIGGKEAFEVIMEHYAEADPDFKKFILRNIGDTGCKEALSILLPVAEKKDFFFKDFEEKLCVIESLSKLQLPESKQILEKLSQTRSFFFRKKAKEISEAAKNALRAFRLETNEVNENA
ncbi:MAG: HEAT repeat domain-containing protein [Actinobacteria bacterium]|nr:HEAT repeat domain-containing protein [Actinomycetota bacterium]